jgi:ssDNA-binding Zn-finger/Zn-ribbon topoisomerase 1
MADTVKCPLCGTKMNIFFWDSASRLRMALCDNMNCTEYRHPFNPDWGKNKERENVTAEPTGYSEFFGEEVSPAPAW